MLVLAIVEIRPSLLALLVTPVNSLIALLRILVRREGGISLSVLVKCLGTHWMDWDTCIFPFVYSFFHMNWMC